VRPRYLGHWAKLRLYGKLPRQFGRLLDNSLPEKDFP